MAKRRLSMRKIKEVLRLKWAHKLSNRKIAKSCFVSRSTVADYLLRAKLAGLSWPLDPELDDAAIENLLFPVTNKSVPAESRMPDMEYLYRELKRKSVTMQLLWYEYKQINPDGYQYSQFCNLYRQWVKKLDLTLRQEHRAGKKLFIDYAGQTVSIVDSKTGEITEAQIFLATLGASNYTFAEASPSQELPESDVITVQSGIRFSNNPDMVIRLSCWSSIANTLGISPLSHPFIIHVCQFFPIPLIVTARVYNLLSDTISRPKALSISEKAVQV